MGEFRPSYQAYGGGRNLEIIVADNLKAVNNLYVCRSQPPPLYCPPRPIVKPSKRFSKMRRGWWNDPENKKRKRVVKYKFYIVEGKMRSSIKKGYRWIKTNCSKIIHGF